MTLSDQQLMCGIRERDADAFEALCARYREPLRRHLLRMLRDADAADDHLTRRPGGESTNVRIANAETAQFAAGGGAADLSEAIEQFLRWAVDVGCLEHDVSSYYRKHLRWREILPEKVTPTTYIVKNELLRFSRCLKQ